MSHPKPQPAADERVLTQPTEAERHNFGAAFERIVGLMARLRAENGCPWDRAQDLKTLRPYLIEETYEVLEALEKGDVAHHREELGDLLLQVVFHAEIRRQEGAFDAADVAHAIADKLVRRHPHVFGDQSAHDSTAAFARWEEMKAKEKVGRSAIAGVPNELPALLRAQRITDKASHAGFDWPDARGVIEKLEEETNELKAAVASGDRQAIEHELGDALFTLVNLARFYNIAAEDALRATIDRFARRFQHVETAIKESGRAMKEATLEEMEALWQEAKLHD